MSVAITAQSFQPVIGLGWTGSLSYDMEQEIPSAKLGLLYTPKNENVITNLELSGNYYYDIVGENMNRTDKSFYNVKIQVAKEVIEDWNVVGYVGYINAFDGDLMKSYRGNYRTSLSWGVGFKQQMTTLQESFYSSNWRVIQT